MEQQRTEDRWLTVADIVAELDVHEGTVRRWIRERELPALSLGQKSGYRIRREDFDQFIEDRMTDAKKAVA